MFNETAVERESRGAHFFVDRLKGGFRESKRCSKDTLPKSYITEHTSVYEDKTKTTFYLTGGVCAMVQLRRVYDTDISSRTISLEVGAIPDK